MFIFIFLLSPLHLVEDLVIWAGHHIFTVDLSLGKNKNLFLIDPAQCAMSPLPLFVKGHHWIGFT